MTKYYLKLNINYIHINKLIKKNSNNYIYNKKIIFTKEGFIKKEKMEYVKYILVVLGKIYLAFLFHISMRNGK